MNEQFVGGDTASDAIPIIQRLRAEDKGAMLVYSAEVDELKKDGRHAPSHGSTSKASSDSNPELSLPPHKRIVEEMLRSIDVAAQTNADTPAGSGREKGRTWVAIKLVSSQI